MRTLRSLLIAIALSVDTVSASVRAEDSPPTIAEVVKKYHELGLPLPPKDAKLVRCTFGSDASKHDPDNDWLAFEVVPKTRRDGPVVMKGARQFSYSGGVAAAKPDVALLKAINPNLCTFELAVQCHERGWIEFANEILKRVNARKESLDDTLDGVALDYWIEVLHHPSRPRAPAVGPLRAILARNKETDDLYRPTLTSLELALAPSKARPGSLDSLIDGLVDYRFADKPCTPPDGHFLKVLDRGFEIVPTLIAHLDDARLTRTWLHAFNNQRPRFLKVGDVCNEILITIAAQPYNIGQRTPRKKAQEWWKSAAAMGEEKYLISRLTRRLLKEDDEPFDAEAPPPDMRLFAERFPHRFGEAYKRLIEEWPANESETVPRIIFHSSLKREAKLQHLEAALKHPKCRHRTGVLAVIGSIDSERFAARLAEAIDAIPAICDSEDYHLLVTELAAHTREPNVWNALAKLARRADPRLRAVIFTSSSSYRGEFACREQTALLAAYLDDEAEFDADEKGSKMQIRNQVALEIASLAEIEIDRDAKRSDAEWTALRMQMREMAAKLAARPRTPNARADEMSEIDNWRYWGCASWLRK